jgi:hypothetical protein
LFVDECRGVGNRFQAFDGDRLAGHLADPISALLDTLKGTLDLLQRLPIELVLSE